MLLVIPNSSHGVVSTLVSGQNAMISRWFVRFFCSFNNFIRLKCVLLLWQPSRSIDRMKIWFAIQFTLIICDVYWQILMPSNFEIKWTICEPFMAPNWPRFRNKKKTAFCKWLLNYCFLPALNRYTYIFDTRFQSIDWSNFFEMYSYHNCMRIGRNDYHNHWSFTCKQKDATIDYVLNQCDNAPLTSIHFEMSNKCLKQ